MLFTILRFFAEVAEKFLNGILCATRGEEKITENEWYDLINIFISGMFATGSHATFLNYVKCINKSLNSSWHTFCKANKKDV